MLDADVEVDRRDLTVRAALAVAPGERLALFGPSGAGKTTVLEAIAGLVAPRRARIALGGRLLTSTSPPVTAVPPWHRRVGLLRQEPALFPHLTVAENLRYARRAAGRAARPADVAGVAAALGIGGLLAARPAALSGGQAHRVALGRLLLAPCEALLLDEPYTGLDEGLRRSLTGLVTEVVSDRAIPAILVAHELEQAQAFADRLAVIDRGAVLQVGLPGEVVRRPASRRVAELVGYGGFVPVAGAAPGTVAGVHAQRVVPGARPERGLVIRGVVDACRPAGAVWEIGVRAGPGAGATVTARVAEACAAGAEIELTAVDPPLFGPDGAAAGAEVLAGCGAVAGMSGGWPCAREARK